MRPISAPRRGVTLVEMLVTVALLVLVMSILAAVFRAAAGAISVSRTYAALDQNLRRIDTIIREDLQGVTARMTPPLDPGKNLGYFEYGENALSDVQGDDTDDYMAFTARAPAGRPFTGRVCISKPVSAAFPNGFQQITITSDFAEIIYFLRNGNLYRRVLLVVPSRQTSLGIGPNVGGGYTTSQFGTSLNVSWQGMNDVSARPSPVSTGTNYTPVLNTLGDLTNRENRFARPRFANDFRNNNSGALGADGAADDGNGNGIPDYYPTLYPLATSATVKNLTGDGYLPLLNETAIPTAFARVLNVDTMAFPYVFRGAYSVGDQAAINESVHGLAPASSLTGSGTKASPNVYRPNHAPLASGDSLETPGTVTATPQTWWGFPTWRETLAPAWLEPVKRLNESISVGVFGQAPCLSWQASPPILLPKMDGSVYPSDVQLWNDGLGSTSSLFSANPSYPESIYQDDLLMTGVRSFDIKAYDDVSASYEDLGYSDRIKNPVPNYQTALADLLTFRHEGRIPPKVEDRRLDANFPVSPTTGKPRFLGDEQTGVVRLRRVFDTWSTDYTNAPAVPINPWQGPPFSEPVYPSYPPPYPLALRGIQVEIRLADPKNERTKTLTIRQDFTDKL